MYIHIPLHQQDGIESFRISIKTSTDSNNQAVGFKSINLPFAVKEPAVPDNTARKTTFSFSRRPEKMVFPKKCAGI